MLLIKSHSDFEKKAFSDPHKTEIATKILNYAKVSNREKKRKAQTRKTETKTKTKVLTGRDVPLQFQAAINYKIKTGDLRALQFSAGSSPTPVVTKVRVLA